MAIEKRSHGFGSDIAKVTKLTGVDFIAKKIAQSLGYEDCGCAGREQALNNPDLLVNKVFYKTKEVDDTEKKD
jgi:hypothetical protein